MNQLQDVYHGIQPVALHLPEESATSRLYCSTAVGMEAHISSLVEAFLVEIYRCRVCQFTSSLKARISCHVTERHDLGHASQPLSCLEKDEAQSLPVEVGVSGEDLDSGSSPYDLEDDLRSTKDRDDHMALERMPFLLPMYGMLQNISPPSSDMGLAPSAEVTHACEVNTLFEEEGEDKPSEDASQFHLEESSSVELPGPLSCSVRTGSPGAQDEETAQSAHLMSLGLYRISSMKCVSQAGNLESRSGSLQLASVGSDVSIEEHTPPPLPTELQKPAETAGLSCTECHKPLPSQSSLELHLKNHGADQTSKSRHSDQAAKEESQKQNHGKGKQKSSGSRSHQCGLCPRVFRSTRSRDAHRERHSDRGRTASQCARCRAWCRSEQGFEQYDHWNTQGSFRCPRCTYTDKAWDEVQKHMERQHGGQENQPSTVTMCSAKQASPLCHKDNADPVDQGTGEMEVRKRINRRRTKRGRRNRGGANRVDPGVTVSNKRKDFCCPLCDRTFSSSLTLRRHMGVHQDHKPFECPQCSYSTRLKASLVQHLRVHTGERPFRCAHCPYASIDSSSLLRHSRTHTQEKPHRCQHCPYSSIQKKSLDLHVRRHHTGESFPCHLCCYSTPDRQLLLRHLRRHHDPDPTLPSVSQRHTRVPTLSPLRHDDSQSS